MNNIPEILIEKELKNIISSFKKVKSEKELYSFMNNIYMTSTEVLVANNDIEESSKIACCKGCGTCCKLNVSILPIEAISILSYINSLWSDSEKESFFKKLKEFYIRCQGLTDEDRIVAGIPCIFLSDEEDCMIYPVRPLICRSITSINVEDCIDSFTATVFGEEVTVLMNIFQKRLMDHVFILLSEEMDRNGYDSRSAELLISLNYFLKSKDCVEDFLNKNKAEYC